MIFVSVGTTKFPFNRLLTAVDKAMIALKSREDLIVQQGESNYRFKYEHVRQPKEISFGRMINLIKTARIVVSHGGPATIFLAIKYSSHKPVVVPRSGDLGEHVNEHQCLFASSLAKIKKVKVILLKDDLKKELYEYFQKPEKNISRDNFAPAENLIENLVNFTENINA